MHVQSIKHCVAYFYFFCTEPCFTVVVQPASLLLKQNYLFVGCSLKHSLDSISLPVSTILLAEIFFIKSLFSINSLSAYPLATTNFVLIAFYFECCLQFSKHFFEPVHFRTTTFSDFPFAKHTFEMTFSNCPYHSRLEPETFDRYYNFQQFFALQQFIEKEFQFKLQPHYPKLVKLVFTTNYLLCNQITRTHNRG